MTKLLFSGFLTLLLLFSACDEHPETSEEAIVETPSEELVESSDNSSVPPLRSSGRLRVATTTSLYDTGLWSYLEPMFEEEYGIELDVLYAGTGKALEWGIRGDVDVITVHSRSREEQFIEDGYGLQRVPFAYNYFLIVGPPDDPAGLQGLNPEDALAALIQSGETAFISRGDDSGTHGKEKSIWAAAGYDYEDVRTSGEWYVEGGSGMGPTLVMADEMEAYTLSDIGTYITYSRELDLEPVVDQGEMLLNVYSVIGVSSSGNPEMSAGLCEFLVSEPVQQLIGNYGAEEYGMQLFTPCAGEDPQGM